MSKLLKTVLLTAAATGVAAVALNKLDLDSVRAAQGHPNSGVPGPNPEDMGEEDVAMLLNELASQL